MMKVCDSLSDTVVQSLKKERLFGYLPRSQLLKLVRNAMKSAANSRDNKISAVLDKVMQQGVSEDSTLVSA